MLSINSILPENVIDINIRCEHGWKKNVKKKMEWKRMGRAFTWLNRLELISNAQLSSMENYTWANQIYFSVDFANGFSTYQTSNDGFDYIKSLLTFHFHISSINLQVYGAEIFRKNHYVTFKMGKFVSLFIDDHNSRSWYFTSI